MNKQGASLQYGSDAIVQWLIDLGIEYVALNPGASFRGLHDSLVNGPQPNKPKVITCLDEGVAVAVAHGYAKATGKPMAVALHNLVGLQNAAMAIFNAWCDRVPMLLLGGTGPMAAEQRRPWIDWIHTALVQGNQVRDYVKWDDQPYSLAAVPEALARGYRLAMQEPAGPVYINFDVSLQEQRLPDGFVPESIALLRDFSQPVPSGDDLARLNALLLEAQFPVICTDYVGQSPDAYRHLVELAETLAVPVVDLGFRHNFPNRHPLAAAPYRDEALRRADLIVALDVEDVYGVVRDYPQARVVEAGPKALGTRSFAATYQRLVPTELSLVGSIVHAMPALVADARRQLQAASPAVQQKLAARRHVCEQLSAAKQSERQQLVADLRQQTGSHLPLPVLASVLADALESEQFIVGNGHLKGKVQEFFPLPDPRHHLGREGGGGLGYGLGASIGAALAVAGEDKFVVNLQADGDFLYTPQALWTMAHYNLPILIVMDNNRYYGNTLNHARNVAKARDRHNPDLDTATALTRPEVNFVKLAESFGVWAKGTFHTEAELRSALTEAIAYVKEHRRPALVDVLTEPIGVGT